MQQSWATARGPDTGVAEVIQASHGQKNDLWRGERRCAGGNWHGSSGCLPFSRRQTAARASRQGKLAAVAGRFMEQWQACLPGAATTTEPGTTTAESNPQTCKGLVKDWPRTVKRRQAQSPVDWSWVSLRRCQLSQVSSKQECANFTRLGSWGKEVV